jgi:hypothetical protein
MGELGDEVESIMRAEYTELETLRAQVQRVRELPCPPLWDGVSDYERGMHDGLIAALRALDGGSSDE